MGVVDFADQGPDSVVVTVCYEQDGQVFLATICTGTFFLFFSCRCVVEVDLFQSFGDSDLRLDRFSSNMFKHFHPGLETLKVFGY